MQTIPSLPLLCSTTRITPRGCIALCALALGALAGCPPPPPVDAGSDAAPDVASDAAVTPDAPETNPDARADTGPAPDAPSDTGATPDAPSGVCNTIDLSTAPVVTLMASSTPPPAATGGTIADGVYVLQRAYVYSASGDAGVSPFLPPLREAFEVRGSRFDLATSLGSMETRVSATFTTAGNMLIFTPTCPSSPGSSAFMYSVGPGDQVTLTGGGGAGGSQAELQFTRR